MLGSPEEGEDALQQTFLRAHRALVAHGRARRAAPLAVRDRAQPLPHHPRRPQDRGRARRGARARDRRPQRAARAARGPARAARRHRAPARRPALRARARGDRRPLPRGDRRGDRGARGQGQGAGAPGPDAADRRARRARDPVRGRARAARRPRAAASFAEARCGAISRCASRAAPTRTPSPSSAARSRWCFRCCRAPGSRRRSSAPSAVVAAASPPGRTAHGGRRDRGGLAAKSLGAKLAIGAALAGGTRWRRLVVEHVAERRAPPYAGPRRRLAPRRLGTRPPPAGLRRAPATRTPPDRRRRTRLRAAGPSDATAVRPPRGSGAGGG